MNETLGSLALKGVPRTGIQSVEVGLRALEALIALGGPAMLGAIAAEANIAPNQLHRYLVTFVRSGIAVQLDSGAYDVGPTLRRYGIAAIQRMDPYEIVSARVRALRDATGLTIFLAVWADSRATIVRWDAGSHQTPITFRLGSTLPLTQSATGRLFLALLPARMTARSLKREVADRAALEMQLDEIRREQLSWSSNEILPGIDAYSAPIRDHQNDVFAAMTLLVPRALSADTSTYAARLREETTAVSHALGSHQQGRAL